MDVWQSLNVAAFYTTLFRCRHLASLAYKPERIHPSGTVAVVACCSGLFFAHIQTNGTSWCFCLRSTRVLYSSIINNEQAQAWLLTVPLYKARWFVCSDENGVQWLKRLYNSRIMVYWTGIELRSNSPRAVAALFCWCCANSSLFFVTLVWFCWYFFFHFVSLRFVFTDWRLLLKRNFHSVFALNMIYDWFACGKMKEILFMWSVTLWSNILCTLDCFHLLFNPILYLFTFIDTFLFYCWNARFLTRFIYFVKLFFWKEYEIQVSAHNKFSELVCFRKCD